jgi:hypothetical protein
MAILAGVDFNGARGPRPYGIAFDAGGAGHNRVRLL